MIKYFPAFVLIILLSLPHYSQELPNAGFENWIDESTPQGWSTNNFPGTWVVVSRSNSAHSGSYSSRMEIGSFNSFPIFPVLTSTFPVTSNYTSLSGYYQFHTTADEVEFQILAYYFLGNTLLGSGTTYIKNPSAAYTPFVMDITLSGNELADSLMIQFQIVGGDENDYGIGSYALIDDLSLGNTTGLTSTGIIPEKFSLKQNYPNPFNPSTSIEFSIPEQSFVELKLFDVIGKEVAVLVEEEKPAGTYKAVFEGTNLPSGTYFYRLTAGGFVESKKMILLK